MAATPPLRVCIVGAGVAGLACAKRLLALQPTAKVTLLDKGRGIGGRCATRRIRIGDGEGSPGPWPCLAYTGGSNHAGESVRAER